MIALLIPPALCFVLYGYIIFSGNNHYGFNFLWLTAPYAAFALIAFFLVLKKKRLATAALALNIACVALIVAGDYFNIAVEYNRWAKRGQPGVFQTSPRGAGL